MNKEKTLRKIGVWMDHAEAHFIEPHSEPSLISTSVSGYTSQERIPGESADGSRLGNNRSTNNEFKKHRRKEDALATFYHDLQQQLLPFDEILLLGAGSAKQELYNILKEDKHFELKKMHVETSEHLSEAQLAAKVNSYFNQ